MNDIYELTHHLQEERKQTGTMTVDVTISQKSKMIQVACWETIDRAKYVVTLIVSLIS